MRQRSSVIVFLLLLRSDSDCKISGTTGVTLLKCCPHGEFYSDYNECKVAEAGAPAWTPIVYSPARQAFLEPGTTPPHWRIEEASKPKCYGGCGVTEIRSHVHNPMFLLFDNGSLFRTEFSKFLDPGSFCVDSGVALVCEEDNCVVREGTGGQSLTPEGTQIKSRVKKCCGDGASYSDVTAACVVYSSLTTSENFSSIHFNKTAFAITAGFPVCSSHEFVVAGKLDERETFLKDDGSLYLRATEITLRAGEFCVEHLLEHPADKASIFTCPEKLPSRIQRNGSERDLRFTLYPIGLFLSAFFLAATLAAGCLMPSTHHMLHWKCQTGHVSCLLIGDLILAIIQVARDSVSGAVCVILGKSLNSNSERELQAIMKAVNRKEMGKVLPTRGEGSRYKLPGPGSPQGGHGLNYVFLIFRVYKLTFRTRPSYSAAESQSF